MDVPEKWVTKNRAEIRGAGKRPLVLEGAPELKVGTSYKVMGTYKMIGEGFFATEWVPDELPAAKSLTLLEGAVIGLLATSTTLFLSLLF